MDDTPISSLEDYLGKVGKGNPFAPDLFRGVSQKQFELVPSIARRFRSLETKESVPDEALVFAFGERERKTVEMLQGVARPHLAHEPKTFIEWVVIAQHHGAHTRLLDWSMNCLVALFFAVEKDQPMDGAVYVLRTPGNVEFEHSPLFGVNNIIRPNHISPRISAQGSIFTYHERPWEPLEHENLEKFIVPSHLKDGLQMQLARMGISYGTLFPGLEGVCRNINKMWENESIRW